MPSLPIRYTVYFLAALCSIGTGALYSSVHFAWVCITNATNNEYTNQSREVETDWGAKEQEVIFAAYSLGGLLIAIPSGQLLSRYGCRFVYAVSLVVASFATMLMPLGIHHSSQWAVASLRVVTGLGAALFFPVAFSVSAIWAPATESGMVLALTTSGALFGQFFGMLVAGVVCEHLGYQWIFYIDGITTVVFGGLWLAYYRDDPSKHPFITPEEVQKIVVTRSSKAEKQLTGKVPWLKFFTNLPILSCLVCRALVIYANSSMSQFIPTFFRNILLLTPETNGFLSSLTILAAGLGRFASGFISDRTFGTPDFRLKLNDTICFAGSGICALAMALMHPGPDTVPASVFVLFLLMFCSTFFTGGHMKAPLYNAPEYGAALGSLLSGVGFIAAMAMPFIVASITRGGSKEEWNYVFYTITGVGVIGTTMFLAFGSTKHQQLTPERVADSNVEHTVSK